MEPIKKFLFSIALFIFTQLSAQDSIYVRSMVDSLSSSRFYGRGFVNNGDKNAAKFIEQEFRKNGAKAFKNNYLQEVSFPINTFPKRMEIKLDDSLLIPFYDYKISPASKECDGVFNVVEIPLSQLKSLYKLKKLIRKNDFYNKFIYVDITTISEKKRKSKRYKTSMEIVNALAYQDIIPCRGVIIVKDKPDAMGMWAKTPLLSTVIKVTKSSCKQTPKKISATVDQKFISKYTSNNVISYIEGLNQPDTFIVFGGHYDHIGVVGESTLFPGANDNASGIATMLDLSRYYAQSNNRPYYSIAFIAFTGEEAGLLGSKFFVENSWIPLSNIKAMINLDMVGTGEKGITIVNGVSNPSIYQQLDTLNKQHNYLPKVNNRGEAANSDHHWFHKAGVPAIFIFGMGQSGPYHHPEDNSQNLGLKGYIPMFNLLTKFVNTYR